MLIYKKWLILVLLLKICLVRLRLRLRLRPRLAAAVADAVVDASAREENIHYFKLKWEVVVVDVSRASLVVVLESTPADTAGELLFTYSSIY